MLEEFEAPFHLMDAEWQRILSAGFAPPADLSAWETDIARLSAEQDDLLRTGRWVVGADDILSIIRRARHEGHHSAMLAWLLDPLGKHGFGTALLERILRCCGINGVPDLHQARPSLEVQRSGTRADIVVFTPGVTLIIENKVDAGEQERQCDRLYEHFGNEPGAVFVFLTPTGHAPHTATDLSRAAWTQLSYVALAKMIDEALHHTTAHTSAAGGFSAVSNYLVTLRREFA